MTNIQPSKTVVIFGGRDFESEAAQTLAKEHGLGIGIATYNGRPVSNFTAYKANGFRPKYLGDPEQAIIFECSSDTTGDLPILNVCDHHNPGDSGYNLPPENYWEASSIGQLATILGISPTQHLRMIAAGDHCPVAAYAGECPHIDPNDFFDTRINLKLDFRNRGEKIIKKSVLISRIEEAKRTLGRARMFRNIRDLRQRGYIPEISEASFITREAYMSSYWIMDKGRMTNKLRVSLGGCAPPETVIWFMQWMRNISDSVHVFGCPIRGFAGAIFENPPKRIRDRCIKGR